MELLPFLNAVLAGLAAIAALLAWRKQHRATPPDDATKDQHEALSRPTDSAIGVLSPALEQAQPDAQRTRRRGLRRLVLLASLGALLGWALLANVHALGRQAFAAGNFAMARAFYWVGAMTGDARDQNNLAGMLADGLGGIRDDAAAARWFGQAADQGLAAAQFNLSNFYEEGRGVPRDTRRAAMLLEPAAAAGDVTAAFNLGNLLATGRPDFPADPVQGLAWYQRAAERGYASAQYNLASMYVQGQGTPKDLTQAGTWFTRAALQGHAKAQMDLGTMHAQGLGFERNVELGLQWLLKAASHPVAAEEAGRRIHAICRETGLKAACD